MSDPGRLPATELRNVTGYTGLRHCDDPLSMALRLGTLEAAARDVAAQLATGPVSWAERHEMAARLTQAAGG